MISVRHLAAALLGLAVAFACSGVADAAVPVSENVVLINFKTAKCLTIAGGTASDNGVPGVQYDCDTDLSRRWVLSDAGGNSYRIKNAKTGKCLAVEGDSDANNARIIQFDCDDEISRIWRLTEKSGSYQIRNVRTDKCVTIAGGTLADNNIESVQYDCDEDASRRWTIKTGNDTPAPPTTTAPPPPPPSYRTSNWSNWTRKDGIEYRYSWGWNPQDAKQIDARFQLRNLTNQIWHGAARSVDCATNTLSRGVNVDLKPNETRDATFKTPNCGTASDPMFKPNVVRSGTL